MTDKARNISLMIIFIFLIYGIFFLNLFLEDAQISSVERRNLKQFPSITWEKISDGSFMSEFDDYTLDQFAFRDSYRKLKAFVAYNIFNQSDNNKIYIAGDHASKYLDKLNEGEVISGANKFNKLYEEYLKNMNVYYSIIPDKNYFIAKENGYPSIDYEKFENLILSNMNKNMTYINLFDKLEIDDYYKTDIHWRQEKLENVVEELENKMDFESVDDYKENILEDFYGVYYGQSALPLPSENLVYCTADFFDDVSVKILNETTFEYEEKSMYDLEDYNNVDLYDIFLGGPKAAIVIENKNASTDKELIMFRDSFGSSLAPLLIGGYKKITVLDLRYIASPLLTEEIVSFSEGSDVLIINCVDVLNSSSILKIF